MWSYNVRAGATIQHTSAQRRRIDNKRRSARQHSLFKVYSVLFGEINLPTFYFCFFFVLCLFCEVLLLLLLLTDNIQFFFSSIYIYIYIQSFIYIYCIYLCICSNFCFIFFFVHLWRLLFEELIAVFRLFILFWKLQS